MKSVQAWVEPELHDQIMTLAKENDRSLSAMARILLKTALGEKNANSKCV